MYQFPAEVLRLSPEEAARILALALLDEAKQTVPRLPDPDDTEALHDFRVGIRRLRSCLRAYRPYLKGKGTKKLRNRLRNLADSTNAGRDVEVQLEWLASHHAALAGRQRTGFNWLVRRLEARKREAYEDVLTRITDEFPAVEKSLRDRLSVYRATIRSGDSEAPPFTFSEKAGMLVREHGADLGNRLNSVRSVTDVQQAHRARISAKRIRYLLEPFRGEVTSAKEAVQRLRGLQDILGDLNDMYVLADEIARSLQVAMYQRARRLHELAMQEELDDRKMRSETRRDERPGLLALTRLIRARQDKLYPALEGEWLGGNASEFLKEVDTIADQISSRRPKDTEIERKFLLTELPPVAASAPSVDIEQGWLPGKRLQERLRRVRDADVERYYRTVKRGTGISRLEVEDETSKELFDSLWPLTEGRRVRKKRYKVSDGPLVWEIDEFTDRHLALAEVELDSEDTVVKLPGWLEGFVVREVTGEKEYLNRTLAR